MLLDIGKKILLAAMITYITMLLMRLSSSLYLIIFMLYLIIIQISEACISDIMRGGIIITFRPKIREDVLIFLMTASFSLLLICVPAIPQPVVCWEKIPAFHWIITIICLIFSLFAPGYLLIQILNIKGLTSLEKLLLLPTVSISIITVLGLATYFVFHDISHIRVLFTTILWLLVSLNLICRKQQYLKIKFYIDAWRVLTLLMFITLISGVAIVQGSLKYLVGGDTWRMANRALRIISSPNAIEWYYNWHEVSGRAYPLLFSFFLACISTIVGLPVINVYVLTHLVLFLEPLAVYLLYSLLFKKEHRIVALATFMYCFGGGLGGLISILSKLNFWALSYRSQDMLFARQLTMRFNLRPYVFSMIFSSSAIYSYAKAIEGNVSRSSKYYLLILSSLFSAMAFLAHYIEAIFIILPVTFLITIFKSGERMNKCYYSLFLLLFFIFSFIMDSLELFYGFYTLYYNKFGKYCISSINFVCLLLFIFIFLLAAFISKVRIKRYIKHNKFSVSSLNIHQGLLICLYSIIILIWLCSLWNWIDIHLLKDKVILNYLSMNIPFFFYPSLFFTTKFGVLGLISLLGLLRVAIAKRREPSEVIIALWFTLSLAIGSLWWGCQTLTYGFAPMSLLASVWIVEQVSDEKKKLKYKSLLKVIIILLLSVSIISYVKLANEWLKSKYSADHRVIDCITWIYQNTSPNSTILLFDPRMCNLVESISLRKTLPTHKSYAQSEREALTSLTEWNELMGAESIYTLSDIIKRHSIKIALVTQISKIRSEIFRYVISKSTVLYKCDNIMIVRLPTIDLSKVKNLIMNPSFEDGDKCWIAMCTDSDHVAIIDNTTSYEGMRSARLSVKLNATPSWVQWRSIAIKVQGNMIICVEFYIKQKLICGASMVQLEVYNSNGDLLTYTRRIYHLNCNWTKRAFIVKLPENSSHIILKLINRGIGDVWFDNILVYDIQAVLTYNS